MTLLKQLWQNDWYEYNYEGCRVQITAALHFFCYTSGRIGEYFESSARAGSGLASLPRECDLQFRDCRYEGWSRRLTAPTGHRLRGWLG